MRRKWSLRAFQIGPCRGSATERKREIEGNDNAEKECLSALDAFIKERIPHGSRGYAESVNRFATDEDTEVFNMADERLGNVERRVLGDEKERLPAITRLCSLGAGNRFISLERSEQTGDLFRCAAP